MSVHIAELLDKAKVIHKLKSDYKLALVLGVSFSTPANYRTGKTLPDARVISKICELTGDDPALLLVQMEEQRAKTDEARNLWHMVSMRLQTAARAGVAAGVFSAVAGGVLVAGFPSGNAHAGPMHSAINETTHCGILRRRKASRRPRFSLDSLRLAWPRMPAFVDAYKKARHVILSRSERTARPVANAGRFVPPAPFKNRAFARCA